MKVSDIIVEIPISDGVTFPGFIRKVSRNRVIGTFERVLTGIKCSKPHMIGSRIWKRSGGELIKSSGVDLKGCLAASPAKASTSLSRSDPTRCNVSVVSTSRGLWNQK